MLSIVLTTDIYHDKMKTLTETGPYQPLDKDPTDQLKIQENEVISVVFGEINNPLDTM